MEVRIEWASVCCCREGDQTGVELGGVGKRNEGREKRRGKKG